MAFNITWLDRTDFKAALGVTYEAAANIYNTLKAWAKSPVQQIDGSLDDTDIIIDGTKNYGTTIVVPGATRTIAANASGHLQGNNIKQRYTFNVDCTITLSGFDATGNNTGTIAPIPAGTYDFQYCANRNGRNLEIPQNIASEASPKTEPNTWYLNTNGNDDNIGSPEKPFENPQAAHDAAAEGDILYFQNREYFSTQSVTITKSLTLKGPIPANDNDIAAPFIGGTWGIAAGKDLMVINLWIAATFTHPSVSWFLQCTGCHLDFELPARKTKLITNDCFWEIGPNQDLFSLVMYDTTAITTGTIDIGVAFVIDRGSTFQGSIIAGLDSTAICTLKQSSIEGDVTITGTLTKINAVVVGAEAVSGATTSRQAKLFDDSVEFKDKVSIGVSTFLDLFQVAGSMAVGSSFAGISTAPTDGAIIEGMLGVGRTNPDKTITIEQIADSSGLRIYGFDDVNADWVEISVSSGGFATLASNKTFSFGVGIAMIFFMRFNDGVPILYGSGSDYCTGYNAATDSFQICDGSVIGTNVIVEVHPNGRVEFAGAITQNQIPEPADPADGKSVQWTHDGSGGTYGQGDVVVKSTFGTTKAQILLDWSAL